MINDTMRLLAETELGNQIAVTVDIRALQVFQQVLAAADHRSKSAVGRIILVVILHVDGQTVDLLCQHCDLHFDRTGIAFLAAVFADDFSFLFFL